jgi:hypothetical protein
MVLFQYHEEHQYRIHNQILKPVTCIETFSVLSGSVMKVVGLAWKNSGASLTSEWRL